MCSGGDATGPRSGARGLAWPDFLGVDKGAFPATDECRGGRLLRFGAANGYGTFGRVKHEFLLALVPSQFIELDPDGQRVTATVRHLVLALALHLDSRL